MTSPYDLSAARRGARTPKPSADRMTIDALRRVLEQIEDEARSMVDHSSALIRIRTLARRALAATEKK